jgi:hypothetical protein
MTTKKGVHVAHEAEDETRQAVKRVDLTWPLPHLVKSTAQLLGRSPMPTWKAAPGDAAFPARRGTISSAPSTPLLPLLRRLLDHQVDRASGGASGRLRTPWEVAVPIMLSALQVPDIKECDLRALLSEMQTDGLLSEVGVVANVEKSKTRAEFVKYYRARRLGGVESSIPLSAELARLDAEGFGARLVERLRANFPNELAAILGTATDRGTGKRRGRKSLSETQMANREALIADWVYFRDSKGGTKKDFCKNRNVPLSQLNNALAWQRTHRNRADK